MKEGNYTYYTIQHAFVPQKSKLKKKVKENWHFSCFDYFGMNYDIHIQFNEKGWRELLNATNALKVLEDRNENGDFDYLDDHSGKKCKCRHKFRIVKVNYNCSTEVVSAKEFMDNGISRFF